MSIKLIWLTFFAETFLIGELFLLLAASFSALVIGLCTADANESADNELRRDTWSHRSFCFLYKSGLISVPHPRFYYKSIIFIQFDRKFILPKMPCNFMCKITLYSSAFLRNSTTSRYHVCATCPPLTKVLLSILFALSPAKPKFSLSVWAFFTLISYAYCENGRTDFLTGNSLFLEQQHKQIY